MKYELFTTGEVRNFEELRSYVGRSEAVSVTDVATGGLFLQDVTDLSSSDDNENTIVDYKGRRWKRSRPDLDNVDFLQIGAGSLERPAQDKMRDDYSSLDKMTSAQVTDVRTAADTLDVASAVQASQDDLTAAQEIHLGMGLSRVRAGSVSPFHFANQTSNAVYRAVKVDKSNVRFMRGRLHIVSRASVASGDVQPAFATDKNTSISALENVIWDGTEIDTQNNSDATNSNQRGWYLTGITGLGLLGVRIFSSGNRRGYGAHIQNCQDVHILGLRHKKVTGGLNIRYCDGFVIDDFLFNDFSEAIDLDGTSRDGVIQNGKFRGTARTSQCIDVNGQVGLHAGNFSVDTVGNIATIQYKYTTPPTFTGYLAYGSWAASTAYTVGETVLNSDKRYICVTSGTSASSGGPTTTGTGIVDGTAVWDYQSDPYTLTPSKDVTFSNVRGSAIGSSVFASWIVGNDWSGIPHEGYDPVSNITLENISLTDVSYALVYECRNLVLRNFHIKDVIVPVGFAAIDMRSVIDTDAKLTWSDLTVSMENVSVEESDYASVKIADPRKVDINGLKIRKSNQVSGSEPDLRITGMEVRGADVTIDGLDVDGTVALNGDSTAIAAWAGSTAYVKNKLVTNSGKFYRCTTAGTSAGAGGPTTTAAAITDGTVVWEYLDEPYRIVWGPNNKVRGSLTLQGDSQKHIHGVPFRVDMGDVAATGTVARPVFTAKRRCYVARVTYLSNASVTADAANYRALTLLSIQDGAGALSVCQITTQSNAWSAYTAVDGGTVTASRAVLNPGDSIYLNLTSAGTGRAITGLVAIVEILEM